MAFICKVKTASGATAVQVAHKRYGRIVKIEHIGDAYTKAEVVIGLLLVILTRQYELCELIETLLLTLCDIII